MRLLALAALIIIVILTISCTSSTPAPTAAPAAAAADYRTTASVKEVMGSVVNPNAEFVWKAVGSDGKKEKAPTSDAEWAELRRHAVALREATDLLIIPGRKMAPAGEKSKDSELTPEAMQGLLDKNRDKWVQASHGLHDAVTEVIKAIEAKSASGVLDAGGGIDAACEACHLVFWYPDQKK